MRYQKHELLKFCKKGSSTDIGLVF